MTPLKTRQSIWAALPIVYAKAYGVLSDGATDDAANLQTALDVARDAGGGRVMLPAGRTVIGATLSIDNNVVLEGVGWATELFVKNGSNITAVKSAEFDNLTGTNIWLVTPPSKTFNGATAVNGGTDEITITAHDYLEGQYVTYNNGGGTSVSGLTSGNKYYVKYVDDNTFQLAATRGGAAINIEPGVGASHTFTKAAMKHGLGIRNLRINGNKANQTAGYGFQIYAKRIVIENVIVYDCYEDGGYSEGGAIAGQSDWFDLPESFINNTYFRKNGGNGYRWRGPHDAMINMLVANENTLKGFVSETLSGVYEASSDIGFMHLYANTGYNGHFSTGSMRAKHIISENGYDVGFVISADQCQIGMLTAYQNCRTTGSFNVELAGNQGIVGNSHIQTNGQTAGGVKITGSRNFFQGMIDGEGVVGTGIDIASGNYHKVFATVEDFNPVGGVGLKTGTSSQLQHAYVAVTLNNCATLWSNVNSGALNSYIITGFAAAGQTPKSGAAVQTNENALIKLYNTDSGLTESYSSFQAQSGKLDDIAALAATDGNIIVGNGTTWVAESGSTARTSLDAVGLSGNETIAGQKTFSSDLYRSAAAGGFRGLHLQTSGSDRATIGLSSEAESGSNAGSNIVFNVFDDSAVFSYTALKAFRNEAKVRFDANFQLKTVTDVGGDTGYVTLTGVSDLTGNSTGVGTIKFKGATSRDSTGFLKIYIEGTAYYVPVFSAITG